MQAQSLIGIADAQSSANEPSKALEFAEKALLIAEKAQDLDSQVRCYQMTIVIKDDFGQYRKSLEKGLEAIELNKVFQFNANILWTTYFRLSNDFYQLGFAEAAFVYQEKATQLAQDSNQPIQKSRSLEQTAKLHSANGNFNQAVRYGNLALLLEEENKDEKFQQNITARVSMTLGNIYRENGNVQKALEYYKNSQKIYETPINLKTELYKIFGGKVSCYIGLKDFNSAKTELQNAFDQLEVLRRNIHNEGDRNQFFDIQQSYYDVAIGFAQSQLNDTDLALSYAEKSRARTLLNLKQPEAEPAKISELQSQISDKTQVLEFAVLEDRIISWVITKDSIKGVETPIRSAELTKKIRDYLDLLKRGDDSTKSELDKRAAELYQIIISPNQSLLDAQKTLFIVPDKDLNFLPFASLINPETKKYLVENYTIGIAPSLNVFVLSSQEAKEKSQFTKEKILSVGNPKFDREEYKDLENLPAAEKEAEKIASFYENSMILSGEQATEEKVRTNLGKFEIVNLASHAITNEQNPEQSGLVLSKSENFDGTLRAEEISAMEKFPRTKLVVLSACQTGIEQALRGEGAIGLARPFIAQNVPLVVASLWKVDSATTAELMISFHRNRKQRQLNSLEALRQAQIEMINGSNQSFRHPNSWSSFIAIGGETEY